LEKNSRGKLPSFPLLIESPDNKERKSNQKRKGKTQQLLEKQPSI
jgi:hypothetical protein